MFIRNSHYIASNPQMYRKRDPTPKFKITSQINNILQI